MKISLFSFEMYLLGICHIDENSELHNRYSYVFREDTPVEAVLYISNNG
jgi:hypothetical protein